MIVQFIFTTATYGLLALLVYLVYSYRKNYTYWSNSGIPYIPFPRDVVFHPQHKSVTLQKLYNELAPHQIAGVHKMSQPFLMIRDPALVRQIMIKDFAHFMNHGVVIDEKLDPLNLHIFNIEGDRWKNVRTQITPALSSGKMKGMFPLMMECRKAFEKYLDSILEKDSQIEVWEVFKKFGIDVIGTCAFGLECGAIEDEQSEFYKISKVLFQPSNAYFYRSLLRSTGLGIISLLKWKRIDAAIDNFFFTILRQTIKHRAETENKRHDFIQHLINIQHEELETLKKEGKNQEPLLTESMVAAQVFVFFVGGYETTAGVLSHVLYELALNPEVADKCRAEVNRVLKQNGGDLTYDSLTELTYINSVIDETLRLHPIVGQLDRICNIPYKVPGSDYIIKKGQRCLIPVLGLHRDPKYWPHPEKFDPDRFSEKNRGNIVPGSYIPFGDGPRICAGMRFAFMEMKATIAFLVTKYNIEPSEKTKIPLKLERTALLLSPKNGIWLRLKKRSQSQQTEV